MTKASRQKRSRGMGRLQKWLLILGGVLLFAVGIFFGIEVAKPPPRPDFSKTVEKPRTDHTKKEQAEPEQPNRGIPPTTSTPIVDSPPSVTGPLEIIRQPVPGLNGRPRVAIVIDDLGRSLQDLDILAALEVPITYAVLPFETKTSEVAAELRKRRQEVLCHLPMEAQSGANPGPGALLLSMSHKELQDATLRALAAVPFAVGVNNHMGSGIAANREAITAVVSVVAEHGLFFLDSRTTHKTLGYTVARRFGIPAAERQVFLDSKRDRAYIQGQFQQLLKDAEQRGGAIVIGHPYPETLEVLAQEIPKAVERGFKFVRVSALLDG
jgi:polysaccharide deacetylase 2 family uncharacterized protein YibQ